MTTKVTLARHETRGTDRRSSRRRGASLPELALVPLDLPGDDHGHAGLGKGRVPPPRADECGPAGARRAIVHGALSSSPWGPGQIGPDFVSTSGTVPIVGGAGDGIAPILVGCTPSKTKITVNYNLNGSGGTTASNAVGANVRVTVQTTYTPIMYFLSTGTLSAASTMQITH